MCQVTVVSPLLARVVSAMIKVAPWHAQATMVDIPLSGTSGRFRFHEEALNLLPSRPAFDEERAKALVLRGQELGITIPQSVREWYALEDSVNIWGRYTNDDYPVPIDELGDPVDWVNPSRDLVREGLLLIARENQGVASWAVRLDGTPDPPVVVEIDSWPDPNWIPCADKFSTFLFCQFWDYCGGPCDLRSNLLLAQVYEDLKPDVLGSLRRDFEEMPTTFGWPAGTNFRFQAHGGRILIWHDERGTQWHLAARRKSALVDMLRNLREYGMLKRVPYTYDLATMPILKAIVQELGLSR